MALNVVLRQYDYIYEHLLSLEISKKSDRLNDFYWSSAFLQCERCTMGISGGTWLPEWARDDDEPVFELLIWNSEQLIVMADPCVWALAEVLLLSCHSRSVRRIAVSQDPCGSELHAMDINVIHVIVCTSSLSFFTSFMISCVKPCSDGVVKHTKITASAR